MQSTVLSTIIKICSIPRIGRPCRKDIPPFFITLTALFLAGFFVWIAGTFVRAPSPAIKAPGGVLGWIQTVAFCLFTGYWEEGFFRLYILTVCRRAGIKSITAALCSSLVFALCHVYEGPLGIANAGIAGILLAALFIKTRSYYGLASAHAAYNILAFILA